MKGGWYAALALAGIVVALIAAQYEHAPGYMDAEYYYSGALRIATREGFTEPFIWNYLDNPTGLPHAGFTYWMPLASIVAAGGMLLVRSTDLAAARLPFLALDGLIPVLTAWIAFSLTKERRVALVAGSLGVVSGLYLPFLITIETFGLVMVWGALFIQTAAAARDFYLQEEETRRTGPRKALLLALALGILAGAMHLTRADGLLWLGFALGLLLFFWLRGRTPVIRFFPPVLLLLAGYLAVMSPWMVRNLALYGSPLPPGGSRTLWFSTYDDLYAYPALILTPARWLASGLGAILQARLDALIMNLKNAVGVQFEIFLLPLALAGMWHYRRDFRVQLGALLWLAIFMAMTLVFPFAGSRGGFFHSGAAFQPFIWVCSAVGLDVFIRWGLQHRGWKDKRAWLMFAPAFIAVAAIYTGGTFANRVVGKEAAQPLWDQSMKAQKAIESVLVEEGARPEDSVMVNNPPGYYAANRRAAYVIPNGDETVLLAAVNQYHPTYVILESNHPIGLDDLFAHPHDLLGLKLLSNHGDYQIYHNVGLANAVPACDPTKGPR